MSELKSKFANGMFIKKCDCETKEGKKFTVYKLSINVAEFKTNPVNDKGWSNFEIKFSATDGKPYIVIDDFANIYYECFREKKSPAAETKEEKQTAAETEEIPF